MNYYSNICDHFLKEFSEFNPFFNGGKGKSMEGKTVFHTNNFHWLEIRKAPTTYFRVYDPVTKTTISKQNIVIEFYNQDLTPHYFRGEVWQNDVKSAEFSTFIKLILGEADKNKIPEYMKKFVKKIYYTL